MTRAPAGFFTSKSSRSSRVALVWIRVAVRGGGRFDPFFCVLFIIIIVVIITIAKFTCLMLPCAFPKLPPLLLQTQRHWTKCFQICYSQIHHLKKDLQLLLQPVPALIRKHMFKNVHNNLPLMRNLRNVIHNIVFRIKYAQCCN